jgi:hypothetical protein
VAESGLPGDHHFFVTFRTDHPESRLPSRLRQQHPTEMTVVLQFQFSDLAVDDRGFSVTLRFGGRPDRIFVPFAALTAFVDPSAQFGLRFDEEGPSGAGGEALAVEDSHPSGSPESSLSGDAAGSAPATAAGEGQGSPSLEGNVVDIGRFRKK